MQRAISQLFLQIDAVRILAVRTYLVCSEHVFANVFDAVARGVVKVEVGNIGLWVTVGIENVVINLTFVKLSGCFPFFNKYPLAVSADVPGSKSV